jgi:hypothetical protein
MLDPKELARAVDLQQRSYLLLKWMGEAVSKGLIRFETAHAYSTFPEAAEKWIEAHYMNIPPRARPPRNELADFCVFFCTYLENSFDLISNPGKQRYSPDAHCFCPMCSWLIDAPNLKAKKPTMADKRRARNLRIATVENIAAAHDVLLSDDDTVAIVDDPSLREATSLVTYAADLLGRVKGIASGPAVLVLWRGFAWTAEGSPKKGFTLSADAVLDGEEKLHQLVQKLGAGRREC